MHEDESDIHKKVVTLFMINGHSHRQYIEIETVKKIFDERCIKVLGHPFNRQLFNELIQKCKQSLSLNPENLGYIISQAYQTLLTNIQEATREGGYIQQMRNSIKQKSEEIADIRALAGSHIKSSHDNRQFALQSQISKLNDQLQQMQRDISSFQSEAYIMKKLFVELKLFEFQPVEDKVQEESPYANLIPKIIYVNFIGLFMEVFASNIRPSFICLLFYIHTFYLMFIGYYTRKSGGFLIFQNLFSIIFDLTYFGFYYLGWVNPYHHCMSLEPLLVILSLIIVGLSIVCRIILLVLIYPFRQPPHQTSLIQFKIFGSQFKLRKRIKIKKNHIYGSN